MKNMLFLYALLACSTFILIRNAISQETDLPPALEEKIAASQFPNQAGR